MKSVTDSSLLKEGETYVFVTSSDNRENTLLKCILDRIVESLGVATACVFGVSAHAFRVSVPVVKNKVNSPKLMLIAALLVRFLLTISLAAQLKPSRMTEVLLDSPWKTLTERMLAFLAIP